MLMYCDPVPEALSAAAAAMAASLASAAAAACVSWSAMEKSMKAFSQLNLRGADNIRGSL